MERPHDARNGMVGKRPSSVFSTAPPARLRPPGARVNLGAAASGANGNYGVWNRYLRQRQPRRRRQGQISNFFDSNVGARSTYVTNTLLGLQRNGQAFINIIGGATPKAASSDRLTFGAGEAYQCRCQHDIAVARTVRDRHRWLRWSRGFDRRRIALSGWQQTGRLQQLPLVNAGDQARHHSPFARRFGYCERTRARLLHLQKRGRPDPIWLHRRGCRGRRRAPRNVQRKRHVNGIDDGSVGF